MIRKLLNKLFKKREIMSFRQSFELTDLPLLTFYQGENKLNFLLDTGSNSCIIDSNVLSKLNYKTSENQSTLYGLEGKKDVHPMCNIVLTYKKKSYQCECIINDMKEPFTQFKQECGVTLHGILGSTFFNKYKYVLDFEELIAYSKQ